MMTRCLGTLIVIFALLTTFIACKYRWGAIHSFEPDREMPPAIDCPHELDVGTVDVNRTAKAILPITNVGGQPLTIQDLVTSCGCVSVTLLPHRQNLKSPATVTIAPDEHIEIAIDFSAIGTHGAKSTHTVRFNTNSPQSPSVETRITFTPKAHYFADPGTIALTNMEAGTLWPSPIINLYSTENSGEVKVLKVDSTNPRRVWPTFIPETPSSTSLAADAAPGSRRFGKIKLDIGPVKAGDMIDEKVYIFIEGQNDVALTVSVSGRVLRPVDLVPEVLYLPRMSSSGMAIYSGNVLCRSADNEPLNLCLTSIPNGLTVRISDTSKRGGPANILIEADPKLVQNGSVVSFLAQRGNKQYPVSLRVMIDPQ